jgi:hypothetical protein|tara:strand:+ start:1122 stop:1541 length:420 start_codon:yes stop_codon:yes gene_type:complete
MSVASASCLCGKVNITVANASNSVGACHCSICRKWSGGPFMAIDCGPNVSIEQTGDVTVYNSSEWAERGFCKHCGRHLFYRLKQTQQYFIPAGLFGNTDNFIFDHQVFVDNKPHYYDFSNHTKDMTEAEAFAMFESSDE